MGVVNKILSVLDDMFPNAECELNHTNSFELIVAVALSAQTTDKSVNQLTENLFKKYKFIAVFHFAAESHVDRSIDGPKKFIESNIFGVFNLLEVFKEYSDNLPTFNSVSIETFLWRISELSDRFLYFNDDVFLTAPLHPSDLFTGHIPVLRGN